VFRSVDTDQDLRLVLLASPLLGPAVWAPVAECLTRHGWEVLLPPPYGDLASPADVLDFLSAELPLNDPLVLIPHSNAGLYVAALAAARNIRGAVFVDAGLPADAARTPTAPSALREALANMAGPDSLLPGWTRWWSEEDLEVLLPDAGTRALVEAEQTRLPLSYFEADVPSPAGWQQLPAAYLAFGDTYAAERATAKRRGWPVETLAGGHLLQLVDPEGVCTALEGLLGLLGFVQPG
jgi:hypothetical protein